MLNVAPRRLPDGTTSRRKISLLDILVVNSVLASSLFLGGAPLGACAFGVLANLMLMFLMNVMKHFYWRWPTTPGTLKAGRLLLGGISVAWAILAACRHSR